MSYTQNTCNIRIQVTKVRRDVFALLMNESLVEVDVKSLTDGGSLVRFSDVSYVTYMKEEVKKKWKEKEEEEEEEE